MFSAAIPTPVSATQNTTSPPSTFALDRTLAPSDCLTLLSQCLEEEISAELCVQLERHLEACGRCRGSCDTLKRTLALCSASATSTEVPPAVQASVRTAVRTCLAGSA